MNAQVVHETINIEDRPYEQGILDSINLIVTVLRHLDRWSPRLQEEWDRDTETFKQAETTDFEPAELLGWWESRAHERGVYTNTEDGQFHVTTVWPMSLADYLTEKSGFDFSGLKDKMIYRQAVERAIDMLNAYPVVFDSIDESKTEAEWDDIFSN